MLHKHRNAHSRPGFPLPFLWGKRAAKRPSPGLKLSSFNTAKPRLRLFLMGVRFSPHEFPKGSHLVHTEKLHLSRHLLISWAFLLAASQVMFSKKASLWSERPDDTGDSSYWSFWFAGNTTFFFFFFALRLCWQQRGKWCCKDMQLMEKYMLSSEESAVFHCSVVHNSLKIMQWGPEVEWSN